MQNITLSYHYAKKSSHRELPPYFNIHTVGETRVTATNHNALLISRTKTLQNAPFGNSARTLMPPVQQLAFGSQSVLPKKPTRSTSHMILEVESSKLKKGTEKRTKWNETIGGIRLPIALRMSGAPCAEWAQFTYPTRNTGHKNWRRDRRVNVQEKLHHRWDRYPCPPPPRFRRWGIT